MFCTKSHNQTKDQLSAKIRAALGNQKADLVIKNTSILDVFSGKFFRGDIAIVADTIVGTGESYSGIVEIDGHDVTCVPGFIDSHVHIESSLMTPARFQESVLPRGTTTALWDPHEITNVLGAEGIRWALEAIETLAMDIFVLLPSCVPASEFETSGARMTATDLLPFKHHPKVLGLAEFMNYPGIFHEQADVMTKLEAFSGVYRDGHAPGLTGRELNCYLCTGISSCHESVTKKEALEKLSKGMNILIREGSCAKNAKTLLPLINAYSSSVLALCSDDRNPADIFDEGHIDYLIRMGIELKLSPQDIYRVASFAPSRIFGLHDRGVIAPGYLADLCLMKDNRVQQVVKSGKIVLPESLRNYAEKNIFKPKQTKPNINTKDITEEHFRISAKSNKECRVIKICPNQIVTHYEHHSMECVQEELICNLSEDILKIAVVERHWQTGNIGLGFVKGFGLKQGAIASSIGHDSHNITVVGCTSASISAAVNMIKNLDGGIVVVDDKLDILAELRLPIGGLMSDATPEEVAMALHKLKSAAKKIGCTLSEPFLTLSFLALPVIPDLKITDHGLIDVKRFAKVSLYD